MLLQTDIESAWSDPTKYGVKDKSTYNGKPVVLGSSVLDAFKTYMEAKKFANVYDHAIGFFK